MQKSHLAINVSQTVINLIRTSDGLRELSKCLLSWRKTSSEIPLVNWSPNTDDWPISIADQWACQF